MAIHSIELCAGVGMLGEGTRAAFDFLGIGHRTVCYVELEAAAAGQLVTLMEAGILDPAPVWSDLLTFDSAAWRGKVDCLIAGFPCQDLSIAGRRSGLDGKRSGLFFDILSIADDCGAQLLVLENVSAIASATATVVDETEELDERAASRVVGELADRGWDSEWITVRASDVGASHQRARWFCLAWRVDDSKRGQCARERVHARPGPEGRGTADACGAGELLADSEHPERRPERAAGDRVEQGHDGERQAHCRTGVAEPPLADTGVERRQQNAGSAHGDEGPHEGRGTEVDHQPSGSGSAVADPGDSGRERLEQRGVCGALPIFAPGPEDNRWAGILEQFPHLAPATEPGVCGLVDGLPLVVDESRTHQLRAIGNGVVPLQAATALVELFRRSGIGVKA